MGKTLQQRAEEALRRLMDMSKAIEDMDDQELSRISERIINEIKVLAMTIGVVVRPSASLKEEILERVMDLGPVEWERQQRSQREPVKTPVPFQDFPDREDQDGEKLDW